MKKIRIIVKTEFVIISYSSEYFLYGILVPLHILKKLILCYIVKNIIEHTERFLKHFCNRGSGGGRQGAKIVFCDIVLIVKSLWAGVRQRYAWMYAKENDARHKVW